MDPLTLALMLGPAAIQGATGVGQLIKGNQMQKNLGPRVGYEIPESAKKALGISEQLASSYEMPGAGARRYAQDLQNQKFVAAALQAGNSQDAMAMLTQGLQSAQEGELDYAFQSAQNYQQRQQDLQQALGDYAGYEEKKRADEQLAWYEKADRAAQMKGAGLENVFGAGQGLAQAGMMGMMYGGAEPKIRETSDLTPMKSIGSNPADLVSKLNASMPAKPAPGLMPMKTFSQLLSEKYGPSNGSRTMQQYINAMNSGMINVKY